MLAETPRPRGGTWNADGTILYAPTSSGPLFRIRASGSEPTAVTQFDTATQTGHRMPKFLPDGIHFLFYATGNGGGIWLGSLDGKVSKLLTVADSAGAYLKPNWVVYVQQGILLARRLDVVRWELAGDSVTIADPVDYEPRSSFLGGFSVSADGRIAYRAGQTERRQLTWFDRTGTVVGVVGQPDANGLSSPELSRDGRRVAVTRTLQHKQDVFLIDLDRDGAPTRFTFDDGDEYAARWSPDGAQIAFIRTVRKMYLKPSSGVGSANLLMDTLNLKTTQDWSKDGFLLYMELDPKLERNLWALDMKLKDPKPIVVANTKFEERIGQISPDGRSVAYETNESSRFEIVAQPFPEASAKFPISINGGVQPRWSNDGKEIYFVAPDQKLMVAPLTVSDGSFKALSPRVLFPTNMPVAGDYLQYAVSREGRFLINQIVDKSPTPPITLILHWNPEPTK
jgi:dipeptidyl aminopeptidase/acylaminoacyl peptidase